MAWTGGCSEYEYVLVGVSDFFGVKLICGFSTLSNVFSEVPRDAPAAMLSFDVMTKMSKMKL